MRRQRPGANGLGSQDAEQALQVLMMQEVVETSTDERVRRDARAAATLAQGPERGEPVYPTPPRQAQA